jgi:hypothetical protein
MKAMNTHTTTKRNTEEKIVLLGSCFANEIGKKLQEEENNVCINPFGTLFNPVSIATSIERLSSGKPFTKEEVIESLYGYTQSTDNKGNTTRTPVIKYGSFYHYTLFSKESPEKFLEYANKQLLEDSAFFKAANTVIITLGTAWVFRYIANGMIVSNCHKKPAKEFSREFLDLQKCVEVVKKMLFTSSGALKYPDKKFLFTVSPVRHLADGAHGNQLSKATLLLAIDELQRYCERAGENSIKYPASDKKGKTELINTNDNHKIISYFPAYEIMIDELRDYNYYAEDLIHPNQEAINYIYKRFKEWAKMK